MYASVLLMERYGCKLWDYRILFIPAGGYSQRLPSWSVLGKLFCPLPFMGSFTYQMIDLIFAVYLPFLENMPPGVLLASSDAIISYSLKEGFWTFNNPGFTALAHLTPLSVAKDHGVYILQETHEVTSVFMATCMEVLQKPSEALMKEKKAVIRGIFPSCGQEMDLAYSDSVFFFDMDVFEKLARFYREIKPLTVEISSYRDFLLPLGILSRVSDIEKNDPDLYSIRVQLFELFHGTPLSICVLKQSMFFHFGSMVEYIENLSPISVFSKHFPCHNFFQSSVNSQKLSVNNGVVMHSYLHPSSEIHTNSVVEYCKFDVPLYIHKESILSNCQLHSHHLVENLLPVLPITIPSKTLVHTVPVNDGFVTICCGINDDIKRCFLPSQSENIEFMGTKLTILLEKFKDCTWFDSHCDVHSLWNAKLFTFFHSMDESFLHTCKLINYVTSNGFSEFCFPQNTRLSMKDILYMKNAEVMVNILKNLMLVM